MKEKARGEKEETAKRKVRVRSVKEALAKSLHARNGGPSRLSDTLKSYARYMCCQWGGGIESEAARVGKRAERKSGGGHVFRKRADERLSPTVWDACVIIRPSLFRAR